jgi:hypothetical protein
MPAEWRCQGELLWLSFLFVILIFLGDPLGTPGIPNSRSLRERIRPARVGSQIGPAQVRFLFVFFLFFFMFSSLLFMKSKQL